MSAFRKLVTFYRDLSESVVGDFDGVPLVFGGGGGFGIAEREDVEQERYNSAGEIGKSGRVNLYLLWGWQARILVQET